MLRLLIGSVERTFEAMIDTGFDGDLLVPPALLPDDLVPISTGSEWRLADGSMVLAAEYEATADFGPVGSVAAVVTALGSEPLIGRGMVELFSVLFDHGLRVIVEP